MSFRHVVIPVFGLALFFSIGGPAQAQQAQADTISERVLTIGRISGNPRKHASRLQRLGEYIVSRHERFDKVRVILKSDPASMMEAIRTDGIDIISETVFSAFQLERSGEMEIRLLEWKENVRSYHSLILVRADSPIGSLDDLRGKSIAFEDRGSTSGYILPYLDILKAGVSLVPDNGRSVSTDSVRYTFAGAEINVVGSLVRDSTDAAAISNLDLYDDEVVTDRFRSDIRVLHETRQVPRSAMLYRKSLPDHAKERLDALLLELDATDEGRAVLHKYFKIEKFELPTNVDREVLSELRSEFETHFVR